MLLPLAGGTMDLGLEVDVGVQFPPREAGLAWAWAYEGRLSFGGRFE